VRFLADMGVSATTVGALRAAELEHGVIMIVEDDGYRLRRLPIRQS